MLEMCSINNIKLMWKLQYAQNLYESDAMGMMAFLTERMQHHS